MRRFGGPFFEGLDFVVVEPDADVGEWVVFVAGSSALSLAHAGGAGGFLFWRLLGDGLCVVGEAVADEL